MQYFAMMVIVAGLVSLPTAVRAADPDSPPVVLPAPVVQGWGVWHPQKLAPHLVLRPHRQPSFEEQTLGHSNGTVPGHRPHRSHGTHHRPEHVSGERAVLPEAATIYRKKVPYSYGYFGAREQRHWSLHRGHQQDRIEWVLR